MVLGSILGSVAGSVASAGVGKLFGKKAKKGRDGDPFAGFVPLNAGGLNLGVSKKGVLTSSSSPERQGLVRGIGNSYLNQAAETRGAIPNVSQSYKQGIGANEELLGKLPIGYGDITKARVGVIQDEKQRSSSDLRSNLARRRVIGSSFGDDALTRQNAEFAKQESEQRSLSYLEELDANVKLIDRRTELQLGEINDTLNLTTQAYDLSRAADQTQLDELNVQLDLAKGILSNLMNLTQSNANNERELALRGGQAAGGIAGKVGGFVKDSGIGNYLGNALSSAISPSRTFLPKTGEYIQWR